MVARYLLLSHDDEWGAVHLNSWPDIGLCIRPMDIFFEKHVLHYKDRNIYNYVSQQIDVVGLYAALVHPVFSILVL